MPQLTLTDEREQFRQLARDFTEGEIKPIAAHHDENAEFPTEVFAKAWEIGLLNFQIPETLGGLALGALDSCLILEELAAGCAGISGAIEASSIAQIPLIMAGSMAQKERFLQMLLQDPVPAGYTSFDAEAGDLTVKPEAGDSYVINGTHSLVVNGGQAAWYLVTAGDGTLNGNRSMFAIPSDTFGLTFQEQAFSLGRKARVARKAIFNNVTASKDNLIGEAGKADLIQRAAWAYICVFIAAGATGVARSAMHHAIAYSKERQTFGRPISQHQGVAFMLADMAREIEAARLMTWQAAHLIDNGADALSQALIAKAFAQEAAMRITTDAVQVYGGYGYSREYPVEKLMRDAKQYQICEESSFHSKAALGKQLVTRA